MLCKIESWDHLTGQVVYGQGMPDVPQWHELPFFAGQKRIVLRNCGLINPEDIEEYIAVGGYSALHQVLRQMKPEQVIELVQKSRLRGRRGAGFPTGNKWEILLKAPGDLKYLICNADEGDPGAYMNRNEIESDPHSLLEGMIIGAYAMGAAHGVIYIRAEYPLAVLRLKEALDEARQCGLLGSGIFGTDFSFDIELVEGAGAFVCGEETALIASLEGKAGRPRPRPPFPGQKGLWGKPTNINNVETWFNVPPIIQRGPEWFTGTGTEKSAGTKVFSLVGKIKNTGLVEMPFGSPLKKIIYDIGGGTGNARKVKAIQTGGPSGGCIPAELFDSPVDYESLAAIGSIMGSGGMVVMDEDNCMVNVARYFIGFSHSESCGKCVPCRVGLDHALRILNAITNGKATVEDLETLEDLAQMIRDTSLCGLGQTAPNPVLTTLKYFRDEYLSHVRRQYCAAAVCQNLVDAPCQNTCPIHMNIPGYLELINEGRMEDAFAMIVLDNPLAASTGRVCQHPCEYRCRRGDIDQAVAIRDMHRFVLDRVLQNGRYEELAKSIAQLKRESTGNQVAIVGAGPAGLTAAFYLALLGHQVTVFESGPQAGGMLRMSLPEYRLPKAILDQEIQLIEQLGVQFVFNVRIESQERLEELGKEFDAIVLSVGTWKESSLDVPGADLPGVTSAIDFLANVAAHGTAPIGHDVLVVGGGNSAIDSARTALRLGANVTVVYRRERRDMPAIAEEVEQAQAEGVEFRFLAAPSRLTPGDNGSVAQLEVARCVPGEFDRFGRRKPTLTDQKDLIPCDSVILAIGERVDANLVQSLGVAHASDNTIQVDPLSLITSRARVYAAGDVVGGPSNVVTAMSYGKRAAQAIDAALTDKPDRLNEFMRCIEYRKTVPPEITGDSRRMAPHLPSAGGPGDFREVSLGLTEADVPIEAARCLRCDVKTCPASNRTSDTGTRREEVTT